MVVSRFARNGAADRADPTAYYRSYEPTVGQHFAALRDLVDSLASSTSTASLIVHPSVTCTIFSPCDVEQVHLTCPRIEVSQWGGGPAARLRIRHFVADATRPAAVVECGAADGPAAICNLIEGAAHAWAVDS